MHAAQWHDSGNFRLTSLLVIAILKMINIGRTGVLFMKSSAKPHCVLCLLALGISLLSCGKNNPIIDLNDPSTFQGSYKLDSVTLKSELLESNEITINAGEPTEVMLHWNDLTWTLIYTFSGTLALTESRYIMSVIAETFDPDGSGADTENLDDEGSYVINGSIITFTSDDNEDQISQSDEATMHAQDQELTLEFPEITLVFKKQK